MTIDKNSEEWRLQCEARHMKEYVKKNGRAKWDERKERIRKHRGQAGLQRLLDEMNRC